MCHRYRWQASSHSVLGWSKVLGETAETVGAWLASDGGLTDNLFFSG